MTSTQNYSEISLTGAVDQASLDDIAERASTDGPWAVHVDLIHEDGWSVPISRWDTNRDAVYEAIRLGRAIGCRVAISHATEEQAR